MSRGYCSFDYKYGQDSKQSNIYNLSVIPLLRAMCNECQYKGVDKGGAGRGAKAILDYDCETLVHLLTLVMAVWSVNGNLASPN